MVKETPEVHRGGAGVLLNEYEEKGVMMGLYISWKSTKIRFKKRKKKKEKSEHFIIGHVDLQQVNPSLINNEIMKVI